MMTTIASCHCHLIAPPAILNQYTLIIIVVVVVVVVGMVKSVKKSAVRRVECEKRRCGILIFKKDNI